MDMIMETRGTVKKESRAIAELEWTLRDFSSLEGEKEECYGSPLFSFKDALWSIVMYLYVNKKYDPIARISLFLTRTSPGPPISLDVRFGLKTRRGETIHMENSTCVYERREAECGVGTLSRYELSEREYQLLPSDVLTVCCTLMHTEPAQYYGETNASGCTNLLSKNKILEDFKQLWLKQENCDVVIRVKGQEFPAHKAILQARSPVLASTFLNDMKEKVTGVVNIEDCDASTFSTFLRFLYCEDLENLSAENVCSLFTVADKYDVPDLRSKCIEFMKEYLSINTFCDTIILAEQHSESDLIHFATDFFIKNAQKIIETVQWQSFLVDYPVQSNELSIKHLAANKV